MRAARRAIAAARWSPDAAPAWEHRAIPGRPRPRTRSSHVVERRPADPPTRRPAGLQVWPPDQPPSAASKGVGRTLAVPFGRRPSGFGGVGGTSLPFLLQSDHPGARRFRMARIEARARRVPGARSTSRCRGRAPCRRRAVAREHRRDGARTEPSALGRIGATGDRGRASSGLGMPVSTGSIRSAGRAWVVADSRGGRWYWPCMRTRSLRTLGRS